MIKIKDRIKRLRRGADYENYYTALDIGTEYIKALVIKREGKNGVVLGASRQRQEFADMQGGVPSDIQGIIDSCDRAMSQAEDMCDTIPGQAVIGIAGELVKGLSTSVTVPRADPNLKINEVELLQTLQLVQKRALREASHSMSLELGVSDVNVKLINSAITSVRIDGFVVNNPIDFQGKQMVITVFNTFAPLTHIGALQTIASELDLELIATVAEPYAMARCAATDEVYDFGGIFIDIGGGTTDIALIRIEGEHVKALKGAVLGDSDELEVGDQVIAIGEPFGLEATVTSGIISAKERTVNPETPYADFLQTDASINPGNSGGPLFNMKGEAVGINTAIIGGANNIGFAVPITLVKQILPQLKEKGRVDRGYLGVLLAPITQDMAEELKASGAPRESVPAETGSAAPLE